MLSTVTDDHSETGELLTGRQRGTFERENRPTVAGFLVCEAGRGGASLPGGRPGELQQVGIVGSAALMGLLPPGGGASTCITAPTSAR